MADRKPVELEEGWKDMAAGIGKLIRILEGEPGEPQFNAEQYMRLYTTIYNMCTQKPPYDYSEQLYGRYREAFNGYIADKVLPALREHRDETLLRELHARWCNHKLMVRWLSRFFNYLDRYYVLRHSLHTLKDVGLLCFRDRVYGDVKRRAKDAVLKLVEREREGELVDRALVKNILDIFIEVGMGGMECYEQDFEAPLLAETAAYYRRKAAEWVAADTCPEYMLKAEECLRLEEERVDHYLHAATRPKLLKEAEAELLAQHEAQLLAKEHSGAAALLRDDKAADLARMHRLFSRVPRGLDPVADAFRAHVEAEGARLVKEAAAAAEAKRDKGGGGGGGDAAGKKSDGGGGGSSAGAGAAAAAAGGSYEQAYVRSVIALHDKYLGYVGSCFANSSLFHKALKEAFEAFCNRSVAGSTSAELFANFCDNLLKKGGSEKLSDEAVEEALEKVVKLLAYVSDKDMFGEFYRKRLARRLLHDRSASDDHERSILTRLKQQCGAQFTSKMEGMVTDLQLAREKQATFEAWREAKGRALSVDLSVTVLTTGFWPTYKGVDLTLPAEMAACVEAFKEFYEGDARHRRLAWVYAQGTAVVRGAFKARPVEMVLTTLQAVALLLFNEADELSYAEVVQRLNVPEEDAGRVLHSLSCAKYKILTKSPAGHALSKSDKFSFNADFTDKMKRIKVPLPPVDEKRKVLEDVDKDRRYAIDAAIVRTMKARKAMQHQQLVLEVVSQLSRMFKPDFKLIKKRIEDLISREYLERDAANPQLFKYLA